MELVPKEVVHVTWQDIGEYSSARMNRESQLFFSRQREVARFILQLTEGRNELVSSVAFYLVIVTFGIFKKFIQDEAPVISHETIEKEFESSQDWLLGLEDMNPRLVDRRLNYSEDFHRLTSLST